MRRWRRRDWFRAQVAAAFAVCGAAIAFAAPSLSSKRETWPSWLPSHKVPLGIDFTGGLAIVFEPDWRVVYGDALEALRIDVRDALRARGIQFEDLRVTGGALKFRVVETTDRTRTSDVLNRAVEDTGLSPARWLPGVAVRSSPDGAYTVAFTPVGRAALHDSQVRITLAHVKRWIECVDPPDYRLTLHGDRIRLVIGSPATMPHRVLPCPRT